MDRARWTVLFAYLVALAVALGVGRRVPWEHPIAVALAADLGGTVVVFAFSAAFRNSSFYDPYWSVVPPGLALYWAQRPEAGGVDPIRLALVSALIWLWGARLTWNWSRGWAGLGHEDWRYVDLQEKTGASYWAVSFAGIHMLPTLWVFGGMLPVYAVMAAGTAPFGALDGVAFAVTLGSIGLEAGADQQLRRFRRSGPPPEAFLQAGLWRWSRHPNYLGEMGFWWGLWLFGLAADPAWWWTVLGPLAITLMFRFISLPLIEARMRERRPEYEAFSRRSRLVLPIPRRV